MNGDTSNNSSTESSPDMVELCRFEPNLPPIVLERVITSNDDPNVVACELLEDALDDPLDATLDFPVEYPQPDDALLLQCRLPRPKKSLLQESSPPKGVADQQQQPEDANREPIASITGIPEEFGGNPPNIQLQIFKGTISNDRASGTSCTNTGSCQAVHSEWKRQPLEDFPQQRPKSSVDQEICFVWVDLRSCGPGPLLFPSLTSVAHFFRSLMGTSHGSSPWCPQEANSNNNDATSNNPHRIAVLFAGEAPETIFDVRVGDICPSWSLYSTSQVKVSSLWTPWVPPTETNNTAPLKAATLVIFKPLSPRPLLMPSQPKKIVPDKTHLTKLPKGCLWEVYFEYQEGGDEKRSEQDNDTPKPSLKVPRCRMTAPPYLSYEEDFDKAMLRPLLEHWETIREEALQIPQWTAWPETQHYSKATSRRKHGDDNDDLGSDDESETFHPSWNVFPLCHCFPANQPENKKWIDQTCAFVPQTIQLLRHHLGPVLRTALFSRLDPETTLEAHTGWSDLANHVIRCHLPLVVPPGGVCGTWVDGCVETHKEGRFLCFDDSKTHRAFNYSNQERIVLILDLARPENLPVGTAVGGHSDELDQFIAQMNV